MIPEFIISGTGYNVSGCNVCVTERAVCDCGNKATVLAVYRRDPYAVDDYCTRPRSPMSALRLCAECATEMILEEMEAIKWNHQIDLTHYMSMSEALQMARETAGTRKERG